MKRNERYCHANGCQKVINLKQIFCVDHWLMLPELMRMNLRYHEGKLNLKWTEYDQIMYTGLMLEAINLIEKEEKENV